MTQDEMVNAERNSRDPILDHFTRDPSIDHYTRDPSVDHFTGSRAECFEDDEIGQIYCLISSGISSNL